MSGTSRANTAQTIAERHANESLAPVFLYPAMDLDFEVDVIVVVGLDVDVVGF
jgi:hypothetical protein